MKVKLLFFILSIAASSMTAFGQIQSTSPSNHSEAAFELMREIQLENDSKQSEISIYINANTKRLDLLLRSSVNNGKLTIEIYDSNDIKQGNFTVETLTNSGKEEVAMGKYKKSLIEPKQGKWTIKIIPTNATGTIALRLNAFE